MPRSLTKKQKMAIEAIRSGEVETITEALREAGYSEYTARNPATNFYGSPMVQEALGDLSSAYKEIGLNPEKVAKETMKMLEATKVTIVGNGEDSFAEEVADWPARAKAHEFWRKDMQLWNQTKGDTNITQNNITQNNFTISKEKAEEVNKILNSELKE